MPSVVRVLNCVRIIGMRCGRGSTLFQFSTVIRNQFLTNIPDRAIIHFDDTPGFSLEFGYLVWEVVQRLRATVFYDNAISTVAEMVLYLQSLPEIKLFDPEKKANRFSCPNFCISGGRFTFSS